MSTHHPDDEIDWALLDRYFAGTCTAAEAAVVGAWLLAHPERRRDIEAARGAIDPSRSIDTTSGADTAWAAVSARMRPIRASEAERRSRVGRWARANRPRVTWWVAGLAAAVVVAALIGTTAWHMGLLAPAQQFRELASAAGSRVSVTLRDGTTLVLGPATHLRVASDFGTSTRTVMLDGEALFTVVHDARHPFAVQTARGTVRDVGTTFVVRAYRDDADERVAVAEGEVVLGRTSLRANDRVTIDGAGHFAIQRGVHVADDMGWARGRLVFDETPMDGVARELSRTYDLDVRVQDPALTQVPFTATFAGEPIEQVLSVMNCVVGAKADRVGRAVIIRAGRRAATCR
jgi:transmembrane sensor